MMMPSEIPPPATSLSESLASETTVPTTPGSETLSLASERTVTPPLPRNKRDKLMDLLTTFARMVLFFLANTIPFVLTLFGCPYHLKGCDSEHFGFTICGVTVVAGVVVSFAFASLFSSGLVEVPGGYRISYWACMASTLWGADFIARSIACIAQLGVIGLYVMRCLLDIGAGGRTTLFEHLQAGIEHLQAFVKMVVKPMFKFVSGVDDGEDTGLGICKSLFSIALTRPHILPLYDYYQPLQDLESPLLKGEDMEPEKEERAEKQMDFREEGIGIPTYSSIYYSQYKYKHSSPAHNIPPAPSPAPTIRLSFSFLTPRRKIVLLAPAIASSIAAGGAYGQADSVIGLRKQAYPYQAVLHNEMEWFDRRIGSGDPTIMQDTGGEGAPIGAGSLMAKLLGILTSNTLLFSAHFIPSIDISRVVSNIGIVTAANAASYGDSLLARVDQSSSVHTTKRRKTQDIRRITPRSFTADFTLTNLTFSCPSRPTSLFYGKLTCTSLPAKQQQQHSSSALLVAVNLLSFQFFLGIIPQKLGIGEVLLDEQDVRYLDSLWLRRHIAGITHAMLIGRRCTGLPGLDPLAWRTRTQKTTIVTPHDLTSINGDDFVYVRRTHVREGWLVNSNQRQSEHDMKCDSEDEQLEDVAFFERTGPLSALLATTMTHALMARSHEDLLVPEQRWDAILL
ncbi:hypothetical protein BU15DRAFT_69341 [Melanogaster broomeanus]|nr:hypothetical protein BU15DRAFT_69341 [Melanogaster broomeanus]